MVERREEIRDNGRAIEIPSGLVDGALFASLSMKPILDYESRMYRKNIFGGLVFTTHAGVNMFQILIFSGTILRNDD